MNAILELTDVEAKLATPPVADPPYTYTIYEHIDDVALDAWLAAGGGRNLMTDPRFIAATERAFVDSRFWHVVFRDGATPVACATLCLFRADLAVVAGGATKAAFRWIRRRAPRFGYLKVLFCGLPVSIGQPALAFAPGCDAARVILHLDALAAEMASRERAWLRVMKEFTRDECKALDGLSSLGWIRAESPCTYVLETRAPDFDAYCAGLRSHYRQDVKRSRKKLTSAGFRVERLQGEAAEAAYTDELHALYLNVVLNAENKLEILPRTFFQEVARRFPRDVSLMLVLVGEKVVAFNFSVTHNGRYVFLFCGIDYERGRAGDAYFNVMYRDLDNALRDGARTVQLGQTSESFKARLGAAAIPLYFYVKGPGLVGWVLRALAPLLFPARPASPVFHVFKATGL